MPEDATAIIINSPTVDFNEEDAQKVIDYLNGGGKALIIGYAYNDELTNFNKILAAYNVSFKTGVVAENDSSKYYQNPLYLLPTVETTDYTSRCNRRICIPRQEAVQSVILRIQMM